MNLINSYVHSVAGGGFVPRTPDALFANVALLVHMDGTDGQTTFRDDSLNVHTITRNLLAKVDTARKKFGTGSVQLTGQIEGSADYLDVTHSAALNFGSGDWCVEGQFYNTSVPTGGERGLVSKASGGPIIPFDILLRIDNSLAVTVTNFDASISSGVMTTAEQFPLNQWNHFAVCRDGVNIWIFLNGVKSATSYSGFTGGTANGANTANVAIGASPAVAFSLFGWMDEVRITVGNSRYTANFTPPADPFWNPYVIQQSHRWYNDNGSETTMTAAAAQDANLSGSSGTNYILRMQLDSTGDVPSTAWRLEYKKSTNLVYVPVLLTAPALPTFASAGTIAQGQGDISPAWPTTVQVGDIGLLLIESCGGEAANLSVAAGFVACSGSPVSTGLTTNGTRLTAYWCRADADVMPTPTVTDPGDHAYGLILTFRGCIAEGDPWDQIANNVKAAASTSYSAPAVTTVQANCLIVNIITRDNDASGAGFSAQANASLGTVTERSDNGTTSGNGGGIGVITGTLATAGASGNTTGTVTSSVNAMMTLALRPQTVPIIISASANVTAGGENTTARLTAPAGKTTGDFVTGRMWDNENGTDAINITADDYTELAWSLKAQSPAVGGDTYQFRVTRAGEVLEYYAVTPTLTI